MTSDVTTRTLDELTVSDIMAGEVVTIREDAPVADLIRLLDHEQIHGVPVLSADAKLSGVVSATDVLRTAAHAADIEIGLGGVLANSKSPGSSTKPKRRAASDDYTFFNEAGDRINLRDHLGGVSDSVFQDYHVADIMTPATLTVRPDATVRELAEFLARGHIHRALVVEQGELHGIVTAFDIVRVVANG